MTILGKESEGAEESEELEEWGNERGRKMDPLVKPEDDGVGGGR